MIGSYRRIVVLPVDVNSSIKYYEDPKAPLIRSDLERLSEPNEVEAEKGK